MIKYYVVYVVKIGLRDVDDIVWKVGKAQEHTLENRVKSAYKGIAHDAVYGDYWAVPVSGNGRFQEQALQTAFSLNFAPIQADGGTWTEYYSPYVLLDGKPHKREYTDKGVEDAIAVLQVANSGIAHQLGIYLSTVISPHYQTFDRDTFEPSCCTRDRYGIHINYEELSTLDL